MKEKAILEVKDVKFHGQMLTVNPLAPFTRRVSMGNVSMKTKLEYGWVVENIKHLMTGPKGNRLSCFTIQGKQNYSETSINQTPSGPSHSQVSTYRGCLLNLNNCE